uniref:Uncharacterized protein n=1 Tax=Eimeria tenella TaxID=5802 RepID=H9BA07_EIMTE|nr:hypothetical protein [Eimeria tenella]
MTRTAFRRGESASRGSRGICSATVLEAGMPYGLGSSSTSQNCAYKWVRRGASIKSDEKSGKFLVVCLLLLTIRAAHAAPVGKDLAVPSDPESLGRYEGDFIDSVMEWGRAWSRASETVKVAFVRHFTPSSSTNPAQFRDPVVLYNKHIQPMALVERPSNLRDKVAVRNYVLSLRLLQGVCGAAAERLKVLRTLEEIHRDTGLPVPLLDLESKIDLEPVEYWLAEEEKGQNLASYGDFLDMLGFRWRGDQPNRVPQALVEMLANMYTVQGVLQMGVSDAHERFMPFFAALGVDGYAPDKSAMPFTLPYSGNLFQTSFFAATPPRSLYKNAYVHILRQTVRDLRFRYEGGWCTVNVWKEIIRQHEVNDQFARGELRWKRRAVEEKWNGRHPLALDDLEHIALFVK